MCPSALLLLVAFTLLSAPRPVRALRFDLESGHTKCISDDIKVNSTGTKCLLSRCSGAGHLREDILQYRKALQDCLHDDDSDDEEEHSYLTDMGTKVLSYVMTIDEVEAFSEK